MQKWFLLFLFVSFIWFEGCGSSSKTENDEQLQFKVTPSGLKYIDLKVGSGPSPKEGQTVVVNQIVSVVTDNKTKVIENTYETKTPFEFTIGNDETIEGLEEGVMTMKVGGKRRLFVPPELGFARRSVGPIAKNSSLVIDVELMKIK